MTDACRARATPRRGWRGRSVQCRGDQGRGWMALVSPLSLESLKSLMLRTSLMSLMRPGDTLRNGALLPGATGRILCALIGDAINDDGGSTVLVEFRLLFG